VIAPHRPSRQNRQSPCAPSRIFNNAVMPQDVDLDALLACRGGFHEAYLALAAYARERINRYSIGSPASSSVRLLDPEDVVDQAFQRIIESTQVWNDGEKLYFKLREHIWNHVRGLAKNVSESKFENCASVGNSEGGSLDEDAFPDHERLTPSEAVLQHEGGEQAKQVYEQLSAQFASDSKEMELCNLLLDDWRDRAEVSELMGIAPEEYDRLMKRVKRAAEKCRTNFMRQETAV